MVGRFARRWLCRGLHNRATKGRLGPETVQEVTPPITAAMGKKTILAGDANAAEKAHLSGVKHAQRLFTPSTALRKTDLDKPTRSWLEKKAKSKHAAVKSYKKHFTCAAGDNVAEDLLGAVKRVTWRVGALGGGWKQKARKSVAAQSSAALLREAGLFFVLLAAEMYRLACSEGIVSISPSDAFSNDKAQWLYGEDPGKQVES